MQTPAIDLSAASRYKANAFQLDPRYKAPDEVLQKLSKKKFNSPKIFQDPKVSLQKKVGLPKKPLASEKKARSDSTHRHHSAKSSSSERPVTKRPRLVDDDLQAMSFRKRSESVAPVSDSDGPSISPNSSPRSPPKSTLAAPIAAIPKAVTGSSTSTTPTPTSIASTRAAAQPGAKIPPPPPSKAFASVSKPPAKLNGPLAKADAKSMIAPASRTPHPLKKPAPSPAAKPAPSPAAKPAPSPTAKPAPLAAKASALPPRPVNKPSTPSHLNKPSAVVGAPRPKAPALPPRPAPAPCKKRPLEEHDGSEDEQSEDSFIEDDEADLRRRGGGISGLIQSLFPTGRYDNLPEIKRLRAMPSNVKDATFADLEAEERRALKAARLEDAREEERERQHKLEKLKRKQRLQKKAS